MLAKRFARDVNLFASARDDSEDGLYRYDTRMGILDHVGHDPNDPTSLVSDTVRHIAWVGDAWWYGTTSGISIADNALASRGFDNLTHRDDPTSLPQNCTSPVLLDPQGQLWSTFGGLAKLMPHSAGEPWRSHTVGIAQGLNSDKVSGALATTTDACGSAPPMATP